MSVAEAGTGGHSLAVIDDEVLKGMKKFKFKRTDKCSFLILKIVRKTLKLEIEDEFDAVSEIESIREEIPDHQPRYLLCLYKLSHDDGHVSFPYVMVFVSPSGGNPELNMMYASSCQSVVDASGVGRLFTLTDVEDLTDEWLTQNLQKY